MKYYALTGSLATIDFTYLNRFATYDLYLYSQEATKYKVSNDDFYS